AISLPSLSYSPDLLNSAVAMGAMLLAGEGAGLVGLASEEALPAGGLHDDIGRRRAAIGLARSDRGFDGEHLVDAAVDPLVDELEVFDGESFETAILLLGQGHDLPGNVVGIAEGNIELAHQPVGNVGGGGEAC